MRNAWSVAVVLAVLVLGSGCSAKFAYNNLDRFARWGISDYLTMNDQQRAYFDTEFAKLHYWHRQNHLSEYANMLESLPVLLAEGIDVDEIVALENTMMAWAEEMQGRSTPMVVELMRSMTDEQVARLPKKLAAGNRELARPEVEKSLEFSQARWRDQVADLFSRFTGRLSPGQDKYLTSQSVRYLPELVLWADYRRRWQADLMLLLAERDDAVKFTEGYIRLAGGRESYYGAELAHIIEHNEALGREVGSWLLRHLTQRQQERLFERLQEFAADFNDLASQADDGPPLVDGCLLSC
jgi:hypothetical protein